MVNQVIHIRHDQESTTFQRRLSYILDFLHQHPYHPEGVRVTCGLSDKEGSINIHYGDYLPTNQGSTFFIPSQNLFFSTTPLPLSNLVPNTFTFRDQHVFSVSLKPQPVQEFIHIQHFGFDIFETLFFHISRLEEHHVTQEQLDEWDMMRTDQQFLTKYRLHQEPIVDQLVLAFYQALGFEPKLMSQQVILTHDIDMIKKYDQSLRVLRHLVVILFYRGLPKTFMRTLVDWHAVAFQQQKDPYDNFEYLLSPANHFARKIIYFIAGGTSRYDHPYDLFSPRMQEVFHLAKDRGYQIGIHPSYHCWRDSNRFKQEWELLCEASGEEIKYTRQHYLHYSWENTPQIIESLGLEDDSSMGFNHCTGFRCGTGFSYHLYNFAEERAYKFKETPLVVMDSSVANEGNWEKMKVEEIWKRWLGNKNRKGQLCFNFHNMYFDSYRMRGLKLSQFFSDLKDA